MNCRETSELTLRGQQAPNTLIRDHSICRLATLNASILAMIVWKRVRISCSRSNDHLKQFTRVSYSELSTSIFLFTDWAFARLIDNKLMRILSNKYKPSWLEMDGHCLNNCGELSSLLHYFNINWLFLGTALLSSHTESYKMGKLKDLTRIYFSHKFWTYFASLYRSKDNENIHNSLFLSNEITISQLIWLYIYKYIYIYIYINTGHWPSG